MATLSSQIRRLSTRFGLQAAIVAALTLQYSASITTPIAYASEVARVIAQGDLTRSIQVEGQDEARHMLGALREMKQSLTHMVSELRDSSGSIRQASRKVASGSNDLSQRTEQAAGNLQRTASSIVQLTQTVEQSADSSETANQLASSAASIALRGGEVVPQVLTAMDDIHASGRKIADIIGTTDSNGFQTHILALNAAGEAARAGEQAARLREVAQHFHVAAV